MIRKCLGLVLWMLAAPVASQEKTAILYDVHLIGAKIGEVTIAGNQANGRYAARSQFRTTGVVKALKRMHGDVSVKGRVAGISHTPGQYSETINDGKRFTDVKVRFEGKPPKLISGDPDSRAAPAETNGLSNALDPLTALYLILRDQPRKELCQFRREIYDGHRHARLSLGSPREKQKRVTCAGEYRRIAGYSSSEKKERRIPFTVLYEAKAGEMLATRVDIQTKYGKAVLLRR
ncbi:DUF3108 domain-containing protein [uncultured Roseovarius sp.]|uniref:DUF3108 domain-containing protein n=1 Tax=uncultured Roseovarius sp. TaxID=293344 RepID=UPI0025E7A3CE|nr:DUF3108 domain-containing protein [uncultured Roseovarius sp.]